MSNHDDILSDSSSLSQNERINDTVAGIRTGLEELKARVAKKHQGSFDVLLEDLALLSTLIPSATRNEFLTSETDNVNPPSAEQNETSEPAVALESGRYIFEGFAPLDAIVSVISTLNTVSSIMDHANEALSLYDKESQDYLHALELLDLEQYKVEDIVFRLTVARQNRRIVQSFMSLCEPFSDFVQKNQPFLHGIIRTKATMSKMKLGLDGRKYETRVAKDLQPDFDVVNNKIDVPVSSSYPDE